MSSIKISPKHGVNPALITCFWCGEDSGLALMGRINRNDDKAPTKIFHDYTPCSKCQELFSHGIHIIGVSTEEVHPGLPPISVQNGVSLYPTGVFTVASHDYVIRILDSEEDRQQVLERGAMLMDSDMLKQILDEYNKRFKEESADENCECGVPEDSGAISDEED